MKWELDCDGCAACCIHFSIPIRQDDIDRSPTLHGLSKRLSLPVFETKYGSGWLIAGEPCPLLDECGGCSIYAERPDVCSRFVAGSAMCQWARGRAGLPMLEYTYEKDSK